MSLSLHRASSASAKLLIQGTDKEHLTRVAQWVDQNNISVNVEKEFSLDEAGDALDYQKNEHPRGKVVLTM